jgi:hypothetical protein
MAPDLRRVSSLDPPRDPRLAAVMLDRAETLAALRGWNPRTLGQVRRGLRIIADAHPPGEQILASTVARLTDVGLSALRVREVLADLDLVVNDRPDPLHIASMFGLGARTGLRYATAAADAAQRPRTGTSAEPGTPGRASR